MGGYNIDFHKRRRRVTKASLTKLGSKLTELCTKFRSLSHDEMISLLRKHGHCLNCLRPGHFVKDCKSLHYCKVCQNPHHTLLHIDKPKEIPEAPSHHALVTIQSNLLLMTCQVLVKSPQGTMQV